jgi:hypothetical protein
MGWGWTAAAALVAWAVAAYVAAKLMEVLWWRPRRVEEHFARQGIRGPRYRFFVGCVREMVALMVAATAKPMPRPYRSHNVLPRVLAFYHHWRKIYGTSLDLRRCVHHGAAPFALLSSVSPGSVSPVLITAWRSRRILCLRRFSFYKCLLLAGKKQDKSGHEQ